MITITSSLYNCHDLTTYSFLLVASTYLLCLVMLMTTAGLHIAMHLGWFQTHGPPPHTRLYSLVYLGWSKLMGHLHTRVLSQLFRLI